MQNFKIVIKIIRFLLLVSFFILLIVHFVIKDRFKGISIIYYACPLPLIIVFGIFISLFFLKNKRVLYLLLTVFLGTTIYFFSHYFGEASKSAGSGNSKHILFWNAAENKPLPTEILIKHIQQYKPEIVALVEALDISNEDLNTLKNACPEYNFKALGGEMFIGVKGKISDIIFKSNVDVYRYNAMTLTIDNIPISFMIADIYAYPIRNKQLALKTVKESAKKYNVEILVGDFNTPYESVFFNDYKQDYNSFHPYSIGLSSTWPTPFPVIEIDQIWVSKSIQPIKLKKFTYKVSDHKLLIGEYR